jgi:hypothetical protein
MKRSDYLKSSKSIILTTMNDTVYATQTFVVTTFLLLLLHSERCTVVAEATIKENEPHQTNSASVRRLRQKMLYIPDLFDVKPINYQNSNSEWYDSITVSNQARHLSSSLTGVQVKKDSTRTDSKLQIVYDIDIFERLLQSESLSLSMPAQPVPAPTMLPPPAPVPIVVTPPTSPASPIVPLPTVPSTPKAPSPSIPTTPSFPSPTPGVVTPSVTAPQSVPTPFVPTAKDKVGPPMGMSKATVAPFATPTMLLTPSPKGAPSAPTIISAPTMPPMTSKNTVPSSKGASEPPTPPTSKVVSTPPSSPTPKGNPSAPSSKGDIESPAPIGPTLPTSKGSSPPSPPSPKGAPSAPTIIALPTGATPTSNSKVPTSPSSKGSDAPSPPESSYPYSKGPSPSSKGDGSPAESPSPSLVTEQGTTAPTTTDSSRASVILVKCGMTENERSDAILNILSTVTALTDLISETSNAYEARRWLDEQDDLILCSDQPDAVTQRYILALFYFVLNGSDWTNCRATISEVAGSCTIGNPWLDVSHECDWYGVDCNSSTSTISKLTLKANNLGGVLPDELFYLGDLIGLSLDHNQNIGGTIPTAIGKLTLLTYIELDENVLEGTLPTAMYMMSTLQAIDLNGNKLTGTISENIANLPALSVLQIEDNLFEGALPVALSTLEELRKFFVVCLANVECT